MPFFWTSNAGSIGPYLLFRTTVLEWPVVRSVTLMCHPSLGEATKKRMRMVSPALITSGWELEPSNSSALNAAVSAKLLVPTCRTGVQTENLLGA